MPHVLAQDLRNAVLQAAMSGRLTQQLDTDSLISVPEIQDDYEKPFEIPDNWKFVYLGDVFNIRSSSRVHQADWRSEGIPFYRAREVVKLSENGFVNNELFIDEELYDRFSKTSGVPHPGDLLVSGVGTLGATYIVKDTDRFYYKDASVLCFENINKQNSQFAKYLLQTPYMVQQIYDPSAFGTTVATLTMKRANVFVVALPPIEEQARIVARVDELMAKIDEYEKIETQLTELKKAFPGNMKDAILQAAMQGKLTEQLESDGKIDYSLLNTKNYPKLEEELDLPESWINSHLEDVTNSISTKPYQILDSEIKKEGKYPVISQSKQYSIGFSDQDDKVLNNPNKLVAFGDHTTIVKKIDFPFVVGADGIKLFECSKNILPDYLYYCLSFNADQIAEKGGYSRHYKFIKNKSIPLPPIEEQQRIVDKLDQLLPLCEQLEKMAA